MIEVLLPYLDTEKLKRDRWYKATDPEPQPDSLKDGLIKLRDTRNVVEVWVDCHCSHCGTEEYITWDITNVEHDSMAQLCDCCGQPYELTLRNTHIKRWIVPEGKSTKKQYKFVEED